MSGILRVARAVMSLLGPMTGTRATGNVTVKSSGATGSIPANTYGYLVQGRDISRHAIVKTTATTAVTSSGTSVPVRSLFAAPENNLPVGAQIRWDPVPTGILASATVAAGGLTGAAEAASRGSVSQVRFYEGLRNVLANDLLRSGIGRFPAIVLCWEESRDRDQMGRVRDLLEETFVLFVVVSRKDSDDLRRNEGLDILDEATERLFRRETADGECFTSPSPLMIRRRGSFAHGPEHYVYFLRFTVDRSVTRRDADDAPDWQLWETTSVTTTTDTVEATEINVVDDAIHENT